MPKIKIESFESENAADTLIRAEEIKLNSKLMKSAKKVLAKRAKAIQKVKR